MKRILLLSLLAVSICLPSIHAMADKPDYKAQVDAILTKVQTDDYRYTNQLTALGSDAVPELSKRLLSAKKFHAKYIISLGNIANKKATLPLIAFLSQQLPQRETEHIVIETIKALALIGDSRAIEPILAIYNTNDIHPKLRLTTATALVKIDSSSSLQQMMQAFIFKQYENRHDYFYKMGKGFEQGDMDAALIAVNTYESQEILLREVISEPNSYLKLPVIAYLAKIDRPEVIGAFVNIIEHPRDNEIHVRLAAIEALMGLSHHLTNATLTEYLDEFIVQNDKGEFYVALRAKAKMLKQQL
jgi:HEAT repeat protein